MLFFNNHIPASCILHTFQRVYSLCEILTMKVFAKPSAERNSSLILASETGRACIESNDNDSALLEAFDDAKCGGRRGRAEYEERGERLARSLFSRR